MAERLLWIEVIIKLVTGGLLLGFPRSLPTLLGLPPGTETFWPRLFGSTLLGLATATVLPAKPGMPGGIGLSAHLTLDLVAAVTLVCLLLTARAGSQRRGRILLWSISAALACLALVELAWA